MKNKVLWQVLVAFILAIFAGWLSGPDSAFFGIKIVQLYGLVGQLFLNALTLVVVPLVCSSIITGTARMGSDSAFKQLGVKTFFTFAGTTFLAILVGYGLMIGFQPGLDQNALANAFVDTARLNEIQGQASQSSFQKVELLLLRFFPTNILVAASQGQMLGLIVFCIFVGFFLNKIEVHASSVIISFFQGVFQIMMKITQLVIKALPLGVFALVAKVVAMTGFESMSSVASFFIVVLAGLLITCGVVFPLLLKFLGNLSPLNHFKGMLPAIVTAFSTSSSAATMPVSIECLEKRIGLSPRICSFIIPLGTATNMPGTALHVCASVFFVAHVYGVSLTFASQLIILLMTLFTSYGIAGIPSGSLFAVVTVLSMAGLPTEGVALILAVERLLDMCRTVTNIFGNSCCAALIARFEYKSKQIENPLKVAQEA